MKKILLAGATGYLGKYILKELRNRDYKIRAIVRNTSKLKNADTKDVEIIEAEVTKPKSLVNCCDNVDTVISTIGITRQKDGLTYFDVDYKANLNLLNEAKKSRVRKFIYVSVLNGENLKDLKGCAAKEKFAKKLKESGLKYCIIRPNGFFSDMKDFFNMAKKGSVYLFGDGNLKMNPIHGEDLAKVCVDVIESEKQEIKIGGPDILSHNDIAELAFKALNKKVKISHFPDWTRKLTLWIMRSFTSSKTYGPIEFFLTVMSINMIAPKYGNHTLEQHFKELSNQL